MKTLPGRANPKKKEFYAIARIRFERVCLMRYNFSYIS